ncbi:hypothetical protein [Enterovirga rhinocerotis]|uniref:Transmembrane protein n=1 Tax=Enterovirga rhinocerotis TaxID=1339210 RepID=A0A4R7BWM4_9HYPH|nr:hypothetical protein [Enterovirga rhinocerotis]TDR90274.1 hypothetical protein EV668_3120 [Enterovirga rhinocerotis]
MPNSTRASAAYPDRLVEYLFASMMIGWGLWLIAPWWQTFGNPTYAALAALATERQWGIFSVCVGVVRVGALVVNGHWCRTPLLRFMCSWFGVVWWLVLIWLFFQNPSPNPPAGFVFYPIFIVFELVSCARSMADAFRANAFRPLRLPRLLQLSRAGSHE